MEKYEEEQTLDENKDALDGENTEKKVGFFGRLKAGLAKTRNNIVHGIDNVFSGFSNIDEDFYEERRSPARTYRWNRSRRRSWSRGWG